MPWLSTRRWMFIPWVLLPPSPPRSKQLGVDLQDQLSIMTALILLVTPRHRSALSRERGRRAEALSFWQLSRSSGRGIPIGHGLRPEGAQGAVGNQMALDVEGV